MRIAAALWRSLPASIRRLAVRFREPTFTLTAGIVVTDAGDRVLMARHVFRPGSGWGIPGGFVETGEQPEDAARRELREELDLDVSDLRLAFVRTRAHVRQVEVIFSARTASEPVAAGHEIAEFGWFSPSELPPGCSPDQEVIIRRALAERDSGFRS